MPHAESDVIELVKADHRTVEGLFAKLESDDTPDDEIQRLVKQVADELVPHSRGEEDVVYPAIREAVPSEDDEVKDGVAEHHHIEEMLEQLLGMAPDAPGADGILAAVIAEVRHHVEEEEQDILPGYGKVTDGEQRADIGRRFLDRKNTERAARGLEPEHKASASTGGNAASDTEASGHDLADLSRDELYERAKDAGIEGRSTMTKDELVQALQG